MAILVDKNATGDVRFPNFLGLMSQKYSDNNAEDEIREAFKVFDNVSQSPFDHWHLLKIVFFRMATDLSIGRNCE